MQISCIHRTLAGVGEPSLVANLVAMNDHASSIMCHVCIKTIFHPVDVQAGEGGKHLVRVENSEG